MSISVNMKKGMLCLKYAISLSITALGTLAQEDAKTCVLESQ